MLLQKVSIWNQIREIKSNVLQQNRISSRFNPSKKGKGSLPAPAATPEAVLVVALVRVLRVIGILRRNIGWWLCGVVCWRLILVTVGLAGSESQAPSEPAQEAPVSGARSAIVGCVRRVSVDAILVVDVVPVGHAYHGKSDGGCCCQCHEDFSCFQFSSQQ